MDDYLFREKCCICETRLSSDSLSVNSSLPVFQGVVNNDCFSQDLFSDLQWVECLNCGCVQLTKIPRQNLVYMAGHATGLGASWNDHHQAFCDFVIDNSSFAHSYVDIGGGNGKLVTLLENNKSGEFFVLDPNPINLSGQVVTYRGFVDELFLDNHIIDAYVFSHVFEHLLEPRKLLQLFFAHENRPKFIFVAWPELDEWVRRCLAGAINFEHSYVITKDSLCALFSNFGYAIKSTKYFSNNCCWFLAFEFTGVISSANCHDADLSSIVFGFYKNVKNRASKLNDIAGKFKGDVFLAPASVYSQLLLFNGFDHRKVKCLFDSSPQKIGCRLYGTDLYVSDPKNILPDCGESLIIINGGFHSQEIRDTYSQLNPRIRLEVF